MDRFDALKMDCNFGSSAAITASRPSSAAALPFTIFYAGKIRVYNAIPPEKAHAIMLIAAAAAKASPAVGGPSCEAATLARYLSLQSSAAHGDGGFCNLQEPPLARKHSLQRFLEKRRDRMVSKAAPYTSSVKALDMEVAWEVSPQSNAPN